MGGTAAVADATEHDDQAPAPRGERRRARSLAQPLLLAVPVVLFLVAGWSQRFVVDDAFINFRVVRQFQAGNGPVYNVGERVEATTSTLWAGALVVGDLVSPFSLEWTAVVLALALGALGLAAGMAGAASLARLADGGAAGAGRVWIPVGALTYLGVAATWDWATGGLETGLSLAWLGGAFWGVVRLLATPSSRRRLLATSFLVGLGVLVRPDFAPYVVGLGVPLAVAAWRRGRWRALTATIAATGALPAAVQLFRMGYYGRLLPNTLYAKEGTEAWWAQGLRYLDNFVGAYWLVVPAALVAGLVVVQWRAGGAEQSSRRDWRLVVGGLLASAVLHVVGIVRVGGDYMHARLLLTDWFALLLPVFCVRLPAWRSVRPSAPSVRPSTPSAPSVQASAPSALSGGRWRPAVGTLAAAGLLAWAAVMAVVARPPAGQFWALDSTADGIDVRVEGIVDGRRQTLAFATNGHPVEVDDEQLLGRVAAVGDHYSDQTTVSPVPGGLEGRPIVGMFVLGRPGYRLPLDVWVYDRHGLTDPVAARVRLGPRGVPGHEKALSPTWVAAQWLDPSAEVDPETFAVVPDFTAWYLSVPARAPSDRAGFEAERAAAAAALSCGQLDDVLDSAREPLTASRFLGNVVDSVRLHGFRFSADPVAARDDLCS